MNIACTTKLVTMKNKKRPPLLTVFTSVLFLTNFTQICNQKISLYIDINTNQIFNTSNVNNIS